MLLDYDPDDCVLQSAVYSVPVLFVLHVFLNDVT